jgi:intein/homing endonuclease
MAKKTIQQQQYLSSEEIKILAKVSKDIFYFSHFIWVINPVLGRVRFDLYPYQKSVLYNFLKERFNIILKFRQAGITELISMYCLWLAMYHSNKKINIISIKDTIAKKVLKKIKFMYKNLPWYLQTPIINGRTGEYGSASTMEFSNGSIIESIPTSDQAGRSESLSLLVIDEAAIVRWAAQIWAAAFPTLSTGGSAIVNSCITGNTKIITDHGLLRVKDICPKQFGAVDLSKVSNLRVLTHKGEWKRIVASVNKGKLETWKIKTQYGNVLKCTPNHKLYTLNGFMTVKEIIEKGEEVILYKTGISDIQSPPLIKKPEKEEWVDVVGYNNYKVSNRGRLMYLRGGKWYLKNLRPNKLGYIRVTLHNKRQTKKFTMAELVLTHFSNQKIGKDQVIDHIDCNPVHNWSTNLRVISRKKNTKRASLYSYGLKLGSKVGKGFTDIDSLATVKKGIASGEIHRDGVTHFVKNHKVFNSMSLKSARSYVSKIVSGKRGKQVELSKLTLIKKFKATIYDITVEDHHSYITYNYKKGNQEEFNFLNKNTPFGVGGFYHSTWVDAISGSNPFNPIRLYWQMHPDRDQDWYDEMATALGPKRTAQEIDGDFLSSGNTVFDLADIKSIEEMLTEYPPIKMRLGGQYREFNEPDPNTDYFIGADCATGRGTDYSSFTCMSKEGEEAVVYKGKIPLDKYAKLLGDTGEKFNYAKIAPESNDIGMAVVIKLQDEGYPNLYYSTKLLKKKGKSRPEEEKIPGWLTTQKNRSLIVEGLEKDIREDEVIIKDPFFVQEAYTFIYDGMGRPVAMGKHRQNNSAVDIDLEGQAYSDDDIFGKAICNHIRKTTNRNTVILPL